MPRSTRIFKKRPKVFMGKKATEGKSNTRVLEKLELSHSEPLPLPSSSSKKLNDSLLEYDLFENSECLDVVNINDLSNQIKKLAVCKFCSSELNLSVVRRVGLASKIELLCLGCKKKEIEMSSPTVTDEKMYAINVRAAYAFRAIGKGWQAAKMFMAMMNLPPPHTKYCKHEQVLSRAVETAAKESMRAAVSEAVSENNGSTDLCVAVDGTWQKRGYKSLNGVVSLTSADTGKVLDVSIMSKYCQCPGRADDVHKENCSANYKGTSGGMEVKGAVAMFQSSVEKYNVRYVKYLGDGDTKSFREVQSCHPYGLTIDVQKLECIGHVQKRMGTRLRNLKTQLSGQRLSDGGYVGGKNRLTDKLLGEIQNYYGLAIRRNPNDLESMRKAVWGVYFHLASTNEDPSHVLCDQSWCKFQKCEEKGEKYDHTKHTHVPRAIMEAMKPIFRDLSNPDLLKKCLHGKTQNPNESLNSIIWSRIPKSNFVRLGTLSTGVYDAVGTFNDGNIIRCKVLRYLGLEPGQFMVEGLKKFDLVRRNKADLAVEEIQKKIRLKRSMTRKHLEQKFIEAEGEPSYVPGGF